MTTKDEMEAAHEWADQVSKHLEGWTIGGGEGYWPRLNGPNGARVTIHLDSGKSERYTLRGLYPTDGVPQTSLRYSLRYFNVLRYDEEAKDIITVSAKREPEGVAKDIAKRLLPRYLELYEKCIKRVRELEKMRKRKAGIADKLAKALGGGRIREQNDSPCIYEPEDFEGPGVIIQVFGPESITLNLANVSQSLALRIVRMVGRYDK